MYVLSTVLAVILAAAGPASMLGGRGQQVRPGTRGFAVERPVYGHSAHQLFHIDLTGQQPRAMTVGSFGAQITDIALTDDGQMYGVSFSTLYTVDPATARTYPVGALGSSDVNGLTAVGNRLLASSTRGVFYYVDRTTGRATRAGTFGQGVVSSGDLCFGPGGILYLTSPATGRIGGADRLMRVDPVTGAAAVVGMTGLDSVFGLSFTGGVRNELIGLTESGVIARIDPQTGAATPLTVAPTSFWGGT